MSADHLDIPLERNIVPLPLSVARGFAHFSHRALLSALQHAAGDKPVFRTCSTKLVLWPRASMVMRAAAGSLGVSARQRARRPAPPSLTTLTARQQHTLRPRCRSELPPPPSPCTKQCGRRNVPRVKSILRCRCVSFKGSTIVVARLTLMLMFISLAPGGGSTYDRDERDPRKAGRYFTHASEGFHPFSLDFLSKRFSLGGNARHNITGPTRSRL